MKSPTVKEVANVTASRAAVSLNGAPVPARIEDSGSSALVEFEQEVTLVAGQSLNVRLTAV